MEPLAKQLQERDAALKSLDLDYARRNIPGASSNEVLLAAMHKARYECTNMPNDLRHTSAHWLREQGMGRMTGTALLPEGQLP